MKKKITNITKYKLIHIKSTPSDTYPELVTLAKSPKSLNYLNGKKFISLDKAIVYIDSIRAELLIMGGGPLANEDLVSIGLGDKNW